MGNEESHLPKLEIDEEAVEVTDHWSLHYAKCVDKNVYLQSAFISPKTSQSNSVPLEKLTKNLMLHRHPCIVKYISSWVRNDKLHLITEEVKPLTLILNNQSALQICVGLHNILSAIIFLHEKAQASHNNICCASIYVTPEGIWKLGGLEYLKKFSDITATYLKEARTSRYEIAVPPEEDSLLTNSIVNAEAIDKYAFGILVEELLKKKSNDEIPCLLEFRDFCKKHLQNSNPNHRISLSKVYQHSFFNHDFIRISKFLFDLPLKSNNEKEKFFSDLTEQLYQLPEDIVGCQLASLLLSRVVLLDATAQKHFLPVLLQPKSDEKSHGVALFSECIFKRYLVPKLLRIFCVRDSQIRLILLNNFHLFSSAFTADELKHHILPELLVGIKDTNDQLVSMTLRALSHLVLILGAETVIGGKRGKLFTDGRPKCQIVLPATGIGAKERDGSTSGQMQSTSDMPFGNNHLPERLSPDGGEDKSSSSSGEEGEGDIEHWSDWDLPSGKDTSKIISKLTSKSSGEASLAATPKSGETNVNKNPSDITFLDIKSSASDCGAGDVDYFRDMEPVISKTQVLSINSSKTKFDVESDGPAGNWDGWEQDWELEEEKIT